MEEEKRKLEQLIEEEERAMQELQTVRQNYRIMRNQIKKLTRQERTHQLCVRGGELNKYLVEPDILTDEDVKAILREIFRYPRIRDIVRETLERRKANL